MMFVRYPLEPNIFMKLCWAEYILVSTSLALVIAKFFPGVHYQIVSRATRLEHQSLYWGTAVVSNVFVLGLWFIIERGWLIIQQTQYLGMLVDPSQFIYGDSSYNGYFSILPGVQEVIIHNILFFSALIASVRNSNGIPIPRGLAKVLINVSFCCSCFCCCICCSKKCRIKAMRSLVMFSFMIFIYRSIMDAISLMFIEQSRVVIVTIALLYVSSLVFFIFILTLHAIPWQKCRHVYCTAINHLNWRCVYANKHVWCCRTNGCSVSDHICLFGVTRVFWSADWTDTINWPVSCLLVYKKKDC